MARYKKDIKSKLNILQQIERPTNSLNLKLQLSIIIIYKVDKFKLRVTNNRMKYFLNDNFSTLVLNVYKYYNTVITISRIIIII